MQCRRRRGGRRAPARTRSPGLGITSFRVGGGLCRVALGALRELADPRLELPPLAPVGTEALFVLREHCCAIVGAHRLERRVPLPQPRLVLARLGARGGLLCALLAAALEQVLGELLGGEGVEQVDGLA